MTSVALPGTEPTLFVLMLAARVISGEVAAGAPEADPADAVGCAVGLAGCGVDVSTSTRAAAAATAPIPAPIPTLPPVPRVQRRR